MDASAAGPPPRRRCSVVDLTDLQDARTPRPTGDRILGVQRGTVLLQEAPDDGKSWLVVPVLVQVRNRRYRLDWESQAAAGSA
jgi:hypothetical protein